MPPTRNRPTRATSRPASSALDAAPSTAPPTRKGRSSGRTRGREPASTAPASRNTRTRGQRLEDSEEAAHLPSARGTARRKQQQQREDSSSELTDVEEDDDKEEKEVEAEGQGTTQVAAGQVDANSDGAPEASAKTQGVTESNRGQTRRRHRDSDMSGTTLARQSDVQPGTLVLAEHKRAELVGRLADLWKQAWKCINNAVPSSLTKVQLLDHIESIRQEDSETHKVLAPICDNFRALFDLYRSNQNFIDVRAMAAALPAIDGFRISYSQVPARQRTDEVLQLANVAMLTITAITDPAIDFYEYDQAFAQPFMHAVGNGIGESKYAEDTMRFAMTLRIQSFIEVIRGRLAADEAMTVRSILAQIFWDVDPAHPHDKPLQGWATPGIDAVEGRNKTILTEIVEEIGDLTDHYGDDRDDELCEKLEEKFPLDDFYLQLLGWARKRGRELWKSVLDRLDGDVDELQQKLLTSVNKSGSPPENAASEVPGNSKGQAQASQQPEALPRQVEQVARKSKVHISDMKDIRAKRNRGGHRLSRPGDTTANGTNGVAEAGTDVTTLTTEPLAPVQAVTDEDGFEFGDNDPEAEGEPAADAPADLDDVRDEIATMPASQVIARQLQNRVPSGSLAKPRSFNDPQAGAMRVAWSENGESQPPLAERSRTASTRSPQQRKARDRERARDSQVIASHSGHRQQARAQTQESDGDADFQQDTRELAPPKRRPVMSGANPTTGNKRARVASHDEHEDIEQVNGSPTKRRRIASPGSTFQPSPTRSRQRSVTPAQSDISVGVAGKNPWRKEEDKILLQGLEHFKDQKTKMNAILAETFDRRQLLKGNGRRNADLTNRARILKKQNIERNKSVLPGLHERPGLFSIPLKTVELASLSRKGIDTSDLPELRRRE